MPFRCAREGFKGRLSGNGYGFLELFDTIIVQKKRPGVKVFRTGNFCGNGSGGRRGQDAAGGAKGHERKRKSAGSPSGGGRGTIRASSESCFSRTSRRTLCGTGGLWKGRISMNRPFRSGPGRDEIRFSGSFPGHARTANGSGRQTPCPNGARDELFHPEKVTEAVVLVPVGRAAEQADQVSAFRQIRKHQILAFQPF